MIPAAARETVTRLLFPTVRDHGRDVVDFDAEPEREAMRWCSVQPGASEELAEHRDATSIAFSVYVFGEHPALDDESVVEIRGKRYQVDGEPLDWRSPTGSLSYLLLAAKRWEHPSDV